MKLYYSPGACSLAAHIVAHEAGVAVEPVKVDLKAKTLPDGSDFKAVNSKGYVPALEIAPGHVLTEASVIMQYLGDHGSIAGLMPKAGTPERYRQQELLSYVATEIHKNMGSFFNPGQTADWRAGVGELLGRRLAWLENALGTRPYLMGDQFTAADAYLAVVLNWAGMVKFDLSKFPNLVALKDRVFARPKALAALKAEGLVK